MTSKFHKSVRGLLGSTLVLFFGFGLLLSYIFGAFLTYFLVPWVSIPFSVVFLLGFYHVPDTPAYLLQNRRYEVSSPHWFSVNPSKQNDFPGSGELFEVLSSIANIRILWESRHKSRTRDNNVIGWCESVVPILQRFEIEPRAKSDDLWNRSGCFEPVLWSFRNVELHRNDFQRSRINIVTRHIVNHRRFDTNRWRSCLHIIGGESWPQITSRCFIVWDGSRTRRP